jgi:hypothetical protein
MKKMFQLIIMVFMVGLQANHAHLKDNISFLNDKIRIQHAYDKSPTIQVALLLDTSNSMDGLIDQAKAQLWKIVNELSYAKCNTVRPKLEIAIYEYGNDRLAKTTGYISQIIGFTSDLDAISEKLFSLTTNGGSEYCGKVIETSLEKLPWKKGTSDLKMIFIAGNEPFTQGPTSYKDAATDAKEKDVTINTIFCGNYKHGIAAMWQDGALQAKGEYMAIDHNSKTIHIASPYDDEILQLNIQLNATYIYYGRYGKKKLSVQAEQDDNALGYSNANAVSRTITKSSKMYDNSSWDLVDAASKKRFDINQLDKKSLPVELQQKSKKELAQIINDKSELRSTIQAKIQTLNKKRSEYITSNKNKNTEHNHLENVLLNTIKKQAKQKKYTWEN